jgi:hypothetical protein
MKNYLIAIASHSVADGQEQFSLTLNPYDQDGTKCYETVDELKQDLIECLPDTPEAGFDSIVGTLAKRGSMHFHADLSDEDALRLGLKIESVDDPSKNLSI